MSLARFFIPLFLVSASLHAAEKSAAERLVDAVDMQGSGMVAAKQAFKPMLDRFKAQGLPPEALAEITAATDLFFTKTFSDPELKKQMVKLYQQKFTPDELDELLHFYETPVGRKALLTMPELMGEASKIGQQMAAKNTADYQKQLQDILLKYKDAAPDKNEKEDPAPEKDDK